MDPIASQSEIESEREANRLPIDGLVGKLVALSGISVAGAVGGVNTERAVSDWIAAKSRPERELQLRFAYRIALMIAEARGPLSVQPWFKGANSALSDRALSLVLRDDFSEKTQELILKAARRQMQ